MVYSREIKINKEDNKMVIKITENTVVKNENILLIGGCGCGKTRYFVNPILVDGDFTFLLMDFYETNLTELIPNSEIIEFKEEIDCENIFEKLNKKINIFDYIFSFSQIKVLHLLKNNYYIKYYPSNVLSASSYHPH